MTHDCPRLHMHEAYPVCVEQIHVAWSTLYHTVTTVPFSFFTKDLMIFTQNLHLIQKKYCRHMALFRLFGFAYLIVSYLSQRK